MKISNYDEVLVNLINMMAHLDAEANQYQTDIYMYVGDDGNATLDEYINVGGNSQRNDDHIILYKDKPHYEDMPDWAEDMGTDEKAAELRSLYGDEYLSMAYAALDEAEVE